MLFNSLHFLIFFPVVTTLYFLLPHRFRWALLLSASCYFYLVFKPIYILILIFTILVDYCAGILIANAPPQRKRPMLIASLLANIGVLSFFKYFNFLNGIVSTIAGWLQVRNSIPFLDILLPIGLSFHVFQSLSYTIEVYRGRQQAERNLGIFALYVMFYPQLVAGPIERPQNLLHQFYEPHSFDAARVIRGLQLMVWGMFKKVVIADRLAPFANQVYDHPRDYAGVALMVGTLFFAFQIYCDFSGYSDIALGSAQVMGFTLMKNFDRPYFSKSIAEFWKRWHISLSSWFRDYLYISLGGNRVPRYRVYFNLFLTFLVSGLWHGANWTYVVWGGINGAYLILEILMQRAFQGVVWPVKAHSMAGLLLQCFRLARTFLMTCFAWIFFRAHSIADALYVVRHLFDGFGTLAVEISRVAFLKRNVLLGQDPDEFVLAIVAIAVLFCVEMLQIPGDLRGRISLQPAWVRWGLYYAALSSILFFGAFSSSQQFIYFQF